MSRCYLVWYAAASSCPSLLTYSLWHAATALLNDAVKGGQLSYMALALQRERTAYSSLLMVAGAVLADPEPMLARLVRGCIALAFTACVLAVACSHRALLIPSRVASSVT